MKNNGLINEQALVNLKLAIAEDPNTAERDLALINELVDQLNQDLSKKKLEAFRTNFYNTILAEIQKSGFPYFCLPTDTLLSEASPTSYDSLFVVNIKNWAYFFGINYANLIPHLIVSRLDNSANTFEELDTTANFTEFLFEYGFNED